MMHRHSSTRATLATLATLVAAAGPALAKEGGGDAKPAPQPYSLPWQLRPAAAASVVRSDTAYAMWSDSTLDVEGATLASTLLASYKVSDRLAPMLRLALVDNSVADTSAMAFANPVVGATYVVKPGDTRTAAFLGVALPVGQGGGNEPDLDAAVAVASGIPARSGMDNAMFAVNYLTVFPGVDVAWVKDGLTVQAELTLLELVRARGEEISPDSAMTNSTAGLHVGWFAAKSVSLGGEVRYQRWLVAPAAVEAIPEKVDTASVAVGPRFHFKLGEKRWLRPGIAYARGLDEPMTALGYNVVQVDVPVQF